MKWGSVEVRSAVFSSVVIIKLSLVRRARLDVTVVASELALAGTNMLLFIAEVELHSSDVSFSSGVATDAVLVTEV